MTTSVLISIRPEWCEKIASGEETIEVRKTRPKIETPFRCYIYCTKENNDWNPNKNFWKMDSTGFQWLANGRIIGEFVCYAIFPMWFHTSDVAFFDDVPPFDVPGTCLTNREIAEYLGSGKTGYCWHISDLVIYDKPRELCEFIKPGARDRQDMDDEGSRLTRPPQSWCYVEG